MTEQEAMAWIAEIFEEPVENITPKAARETIPAWDSLGSLTLLAGLDEEFDLLLPEDEIAGLNSIGDILEILRKYEKVTE
jgi:acyl carrier protein